MQMQLLEIRDKFELNRNMTISVVKSKNECLDGNQRQVNNYKKSHFEKSPLCYNIMAYMYTAFDDYRLYDRLHIDIAYNYLPPKLAVSESLMEAERNVETRFRMVTMTANFMGGNDLALRNLLQVLRKYKISDTFINDENAVVLGDEWESLFCIWQMDENGSAGGFEFNGTNSSVGNKHSDCAYWNQSGLI